MNVKYLLRKINNIMARGKLLSLKTVDDSGEESVNLKVPMAKVGLFASEIYDGIEYPQEFGFKSYPPLNSETLTVHFGGNRNHATMLRAFDRNVMPTDLEEGESVQYNAFGMSIKINKDSEIEVTKIDLEDPESDPKTFTISFNEDGDITITAETNIILDTPTVTMTGDLVVDGTINGVTIP